MRLRRGDLWRLITLGCATVGLAAVAVLVMADGSGSPSSAPRSVAVSSADRPQSGRPRLRAETKRLVGSFELRQGRTIRVSTADTVDGRECLVEEDSVGEASSCLDGGLFSSRRAALVVSSMGGPERFDELHVTGVVAPGIRVVWLVKTDGATVELPLNAQRAFTYESPPTDLESGVYPTALRLLGRGGKLVEVVGFPSAG